MTQSETRSLVSITNAGWKLIEVSMMATLLLIKEHMNNGWQNLDAIQTSWLLLKPLDQGKSDVLTLATETDCNPFEH